MKLSALPVLMDITKITKITGDYNNVRPYLMVDKVMGGVNFCLGLSKENNTYVPSSALQAFSLYLDGWDAYFLLRLSMYEERVYYVLI